MPDASVFRALRPGDARRVLRDSLLAWRVAVPLVLEPLDRQPAGPARPAVRTR